MDIVDQNPLVCNFFSLLKFSRMKQFFYVFRSNVEIVLTVYTNREMNASFVRRHMRDPNKMELKINAIQFRKTLLSCDDLFS